MPIETTYNMRDMIEVPDGIYRIITSLTRLINHTGFDDVKRLSAALGIIDDGFPTEDEWDMLIQWMYHTPKESE